jgi:hypothetical protein
MSKFEDNVSRLERSIHNLIIAHLGDNPTRDQEIEALSAIYSASAAIALAFAAGDPVQGEKFAHGGIKAAFGDIRASGIGERLRHAVKEARNG